MDIKRKHILHPATLPREELTANYHKVYHDAKNANLLPTNVSLDEFVSKMVADEPTRMFRSAVHQVSVYDDPYCVHLSFKRNSRQPILSLTDYYVILHQFELPIGYAFELFPAESRVVDTANQYHLYIPKKGKHMTYTDVSEIDFKILKGTISVEPSYKDVTYAIHKLHNAAHPRRDWREFQSFKNTHWSEQQEAIQLFFHDDAQLRDPYLYWVLPKEPTERFTVGFKTGLKTDAPVHTSAQRPL